MTTPDPAKQLDPAAKAGEPAKDPAKEPAKAATTGAPEKYELKAPEGQELDAKLIEAATPIFKELGLTNEGAQKLTDFWNKNMAEAAAAPYKQYETMRDDWRKTIVADKALGNGTDGFNAEAKKNIAVAMNVAGDAAAVEALKAAFDLTGAGDNPVIAAAFNKIGKLLSEGTAVKGAGPSSEGQRAPGASDRPSPAQALYPKLPSSAA